MDYYLSFIFNGKNVYFSNKRVASLYIDICNWLHKNGYKFEGDIHNAFIRKAFTKKEAEKVLSKNYSGNPFFQIFFNVENSDIYLYRGGNIDKIYPNILKMLKNFGIDEKTIKTKGFEKFQDKSQLKIKKFGEIDQDIDETDVDSRDSDEKMTFAKAAQICLQDNGNEAMTAQEIWNEISDKVEYYTKTPVASLSTILGKNSENSKYSKKNKKSIFRIVSDNPSKYILINPDEVQDVPDEEEFISPEEQPITTTAKSTLPDANSEERVKNPFRESICILGDPGVGKSVTAINVISEDTDHKFYLCIPTDLSTSMLVQFVRGELVLNKISKMIISAYKNPKIKYTVLIDEFHKPLTIKRVNDELLQAISLKRYKERRFISSEIAESFIEPELKDLFLDEKDFTYHGNIEIPSNFGFVFLSSKPNVIVDNEDLYDRMNIIYLRKEDISRINSIDDLLNKSIKKSEDKKEFKNIIKSQDRESDDSSLDDFLNNNKSYESVKFETTNKLSIVKFTDWSKI